MSEFFTSDTHFSHFNVIKYSNRPFTTKEEMNEKMIKNWNSKVGPNDTVCHLGDFGFCKEDELEQILKSLNGKKILIWGNHDKVIKRSGRLRGYFDRTCDYLELRINDQVIILCHYPMISWNKMHHGSWMLHGHCHNNLKYPFVGRILDVGVDGVANYAPLSFSEIKQHMDKITRVDLLDHHGD